MSSSMPVLTSQKHLRYNTTYMHPSCYIQVATLYLYYCYSILVNLAPCSIGFHSLGENKTDWSRGGDRDDKSHRPQDCKRGGTRHWYDLCCRGQSDNIIFVDGDKGAAKKVHEKYEEQVYWAKEELNTSLPRPCPTWARL